MACLGLRILQRCPCGECRRQIDSRCELHARASAQDASVARIRVPGQTYGARVLLFCGQSLHARSTFKCKCPDCELTPAPPREFEIGGSKPLRKIPEYIIYTFRRSVRGPSARRFPPSGDVELERHSDELFCTFEGFGVGWLFGARRLQC